MPPTPVAPSMTILGLGNCSSLLAIPSGGPRPPGEGVVVVGVEVEVEVVVVVVVVQVVAEMKKVVEGTLIVFTGGSHSS